MGEGQSSFSDILRYELKYIIHQELADKIKNHIRAICERDKYNPQTGGYTIISLYLDSPEKQFISAVKQEAFSRLKLRIRFYDEAPSDLVHFEIKRKFGEMIHKSRVTLPAISWREAIQGSEEVRSHVDPDRWEALNEFYSLCKSFGCEPHLFVKYSREAYFSTLDKYCRITFDENICYQPANSWALHPDPTAWKFLDLAGSHGFPFSATILELKCEQLVPNWLIDIIRRFDLDRCGYSKYVSSFDDLTQESLLHLGSEYA